MKQKVTELKRELGNSSVLTEDFNIAYFKYRFFSSAHGTFSRTDHCWAIKQAPINFKEPKPQNTEIMICDHNRIKLEMNNK